MFSVSPAWNTTWPGAVAGILVMRDVANPATHVGLERRVAEREAELRARFGGSDRAALRAMPALCAYAAYYVAFKLADMAARIDAVRLMIHRAARLRMAGRESVREASMAKCLASELAVRVAADALLLHGGAGYLEEMKIARLYRDAPEAWIGEGTNEIQLGVIARSLGLGS
ncbi:MAG: hypothetical protein HYU41_21385 [Candidatus Rokubacteria bacterium]|nr:hypothetical protein [Candidatus Rokubacteria bacterium]